MHRLSALVAITALVSASANSAHAIPDFQKVFIKEYIEKHKDAKYKEYVTKKVKCYLCHQGKKSKKNHNPYGEELSKLLDKKKDKKDVKKTTEALAKVGKMPSNPKDKKSPTYADLIAKGELPGGKLEAVKKEPAKKPDADKKEEEKESKEADEKEAE